jgi:heterodisulfide reductase subunit A
MANIREHVSWVTKDPAAATKKAKALISAAVRRVAVHDPLTKKEVPVRPETLIVGAGIAGIHAALTYANSGKKVYLVEKEPSIGGHMSMLDKTFPTLDCSACILTPKMSDIGKHPNIELITWSEVEEISGFVGSFKAKIKKKARFVDVDICNGCGACWENCPTTITPSERIIKKGELVIKTVTKEN